MKQNNIKLKIYKTIFYMLLIVAIVVIGMIIYKYGSNQIKNEYPLKITLINNRFWVIEGSLSKGETGGTAIIVIKKDDGQVQYINHGK